MSLRPITIDDFNEVYSMEDGLVNDKDIVIKSTKEEVEKCLKSGLSYGVFDGDKIVAYTLGYTDEYNYSVFIEKCVSDYNYRGNGFQALTVGTVLATAKSRGCVVAVATVGPKNSFSLENFKKVGFTELGIRELFDNQRVLLECRLLNT